MKKQLNKRIVISALAFVAASVSLVTAQVFTNDKVHPVTENPVPNPRCYHGLLANVCQNDSWNDGECGPDYWDGICQLISVPLEQTYWPSVAGHQCDTVWQGQIVICIPGGKDNINQAQAYAPPPPGGGN